MKKIILCFSLLMLFSISIIAQEEVSLQVTSAPGVYVNNLTGTEIKFRRSPFGSGDLISGLTVTHPVGNTTGNYIVTGFTTYEKAELWISGVKQTWWGRKYVGDIKSKFGSKDEQNQWIDEANIFDYPYVNSSSPLFTDYNHAEFFNSTLVWRKYIEDLYGRLGEANTWADQNTFLQDVFFSADIEQTATSNAILWFPFLSGSSPWLTDYSTMGASSLVWKGWVTSNYVDTSKLYFDGSKLRTKNGILYGPNSTTSPIKLNAAHLTYLNESTGLGINPAAVNQDSVSHAILSMRKDTCIISLGECIYRYRFLTLKDRFYANPIGMDFPNFLWHWKSVNEIGVISGADSGDVINDGTLKMNKETIFPGTSFINKDTIILARGEWLINCNVSYTFTDASAGGMSDIIDSIFVRLYDGTKAVDNSDQFVTFTYPNNLNTTGMSGVINFNCIVNITAQSHTYYLQGKMATLASAIHSINQDGLTLSKLR